ncbi:uncharacterized protein K489DRAFT_190157 [Dissoconium aciculare CBS 342.82]|uniref:Chromo domain-containing protein n=1 Tax=Dissoconium aciculare CBS 342.82 TaxID=1314786 RepID=A0A6J3M8R9_9PEZI|nr:uncharacterized protein K489DRAFT_190157 [Dissoconium aciculare CBS 342.82]KAF1823232.1 hypothetical protein K489DRAFT_190157 [Dissoconium aciculare CBS 342.82]
MHQHHAWLARSHLPWNLCLAHSGPIWHCTFQMQLPHRQLRVWYGCERLRYPRIERADIQACAELAPYPRSLLLLMMRNLGVSLKPPFVHNLLVLLPSNSLSLSLPSSMPSQALPGLTTFATQQVRNDLTIQFYNPHANKTPRAQTPRPPPVQPPLILARNAHESNAGTRNGQHAGARENEPELAAGRTSVAPLPQRCGDIDREGGSASFIPCTLAQRAQTLATPTTVSSPSEEQDGSRNSLSQAPDPKSPIPGWRCWTSGDTFRTSLEQTRSPVSRVMGSTDVSDCGRKDVGGDKSYSTSDSQIVSDEESNEEVWSGVFQEETDLDWIAGPSGALHPAIAATQQAGYVPSLSHELARSSPIPRRKVSPGIDRFEKGHDILLSSRSRSVSSEDEDDEMPRRKRRQRSSPLTANVPNVQQQRRHGRRDTAKKGRPRKHEISRSQKADYSHSSSRCSSASPSNTTSASTRTYSHGEPTWQVERIIGRRRGFRGEKVYLVEWNPTWEPHSGLSGCTDAIANYEKSRAQRTVVAR